MNVGILGLGLIGGSLARAYSLAGHTVYAAEQNESMLSFAMLAGAVALVWYLNQSLTIDYGFWGCMLPVFAALAHGTESDCVPMNTAMLGIGLIFLSCSLGLLQFFCLAALPLLYAYNGKRGKLNLKYFFYIFYSFTIILNNDC